MGMSVPSKAALSNWKKYRRVGVEISWLTVTLGVKSCIVQCINFIGNQSLHSDTVDSAFVSPPGPYELLIADNDQNPSIERKDKVFICLN